MFLSDAARNDNIHIRRGILMRKSRVLSRCLMWAPPTTRHPRARRVGTAHHVLCPALFFSLQGPSHNIVALPDIASQLDAAGLAHNIITEDTMALICRSCEGILRTARNLRLACMIEAIRGRDKIIGIANVNRVLIQPHWRIDRDAEQFL
jgi:hypothetical protein